MPDALVALILAQVAVGVAIIVVVGIVGELAEGEILSDRLTLGTIFFIQAFLWVGYAGWTLVVSQRKGNGVVADFGWKFRIPDLWQGLLIGFGAQIVAVPIIYVMLFYFTGEQDVSEAARELTDRAATPLDVVLLLVIVVVGAPIVEELFFRGLLLRSIERRFGSTVALIGSSVIFAAVHFQLLQFPALLMFGLLAGWLTLRTGRLGPAVWAHVGFNLVTVLALLAVS